MNDKLIRIEADESAVTDEVVRKAWDAKCAHKRMWKKYGPDEGDLAELKAVLLAIWPNQPVHEHIPFAYVESYRLAGEKHMDLVWEEGERDDREYEPLYTQSPAQPARSVSDEDVRGGTGDCEIGKESATYKYPNLPSTPPSKENAMSAEYSVKSLQHLIISQHSSTSAEAIAALRAFQERIKADEGAEPIGWVFQQEETGRMAFCENDGVNNPENFAANNPRHHLCGPAWFEPPTERSTPEGE
jgi:hypothetical protein